MQVFGMMKSTKKIALATALCAPLLALSPASQAADACEVVLCMYGKMVGKSQNECSSAEKSYFKIIKKKKGKFKSGRTATARLQFLNQCSTADRSTTKAINNKFGKMRLGF